MFQEAATQYLAMYSQWIPKKMFPRILTTNHVIFVHPKKSPGQTWLGMDDFTESQPLNAKYGESSNNSSIHN